MKFATKILIVSFVFVCELIKSQTLQWANQYNGLSTDQVNAITTDSLGNVYATGDFMGICDFDPGPGSYTMSAYTGSANVFVTKLGPNGNLIWAKNIGGLSNNTPKSITLDNNGNICIAGFFYGSTDFDPGTGTYSLTSVAGTYDAFVLKLSNNGNFIWARSIGDVGNDYSFALAADRFDNIYYTGIFQSTVDFDPGPGNFGLYTASSGDIFISKLNSNGNFCWAKSFTSVTTFSNIPYGIAVDSFCNVYTTGFYFSDTDFDPGPGTYSLSTGASNGYRVYFSKLDSAGNFGWAKKLGGEIGRSIALDKKRNIYITGTFRSSEDFDPDTSTFTLNAVSGNAEGFICKFNPLGKFVWAKALNGTTFSGEIVPYSIKVSNNYEVYTSGFYRYFMDGDPGPNTYTLTTGPLPDVFVSTLDSSGDFINLFGIGGNDQDFCYSMDVDKNNSIYFCGKFTSSCDFDPDTSKYIITSGTFEDGFVAKYCQVRITSDSGTTFCEGDSIILTAGPALSYTWSTGANTQTISVDTAGTYFVRIINGSCSGISNPITVSIQTCSAIGIKENTFSGQIKLFPNPNNGTFTLNLNEEIKNAELTILNALGQKILSTKVQRGNNQITTKNIAAGLYFYELRSDSNNSGYGRIVFE